MKAWYLYGANDMRLIEVPDPELKEAHLIAKILCAQPSITETQMVGGSLNRFGFQERIKKEGAVPVPGHEYCARVVKSTEGSEFSPGDRVVGVAKIPCGRCLMCLGGRPLLCKQMNVMGATIPGCFSELALLPENSLIRVDDRVSDSEATCLQPLSDCVAAVDTAGLHIGDIVVIFGQGCLGINLLQVTRVSGAGMIIAVDVRDEILQVSKELGADYVINGRSTDSVDAIRRLTNERGADIIFEAAGGNPKQGLAGIQTMKQAIDSVTPGGKVVILSIYGQSVELPIDVLRTRSLNLVGPRLTTTTHLRHASRLVASEQVRLKPIITQVLTGIENVPKAFEMTADKGKQNSIMPVQVIMSS